MKFFRCDIIENKKIIEEKWHLLKNKNAILIDVRSPQEYEEGHINGAISLPEYEIEEKIGKIIKEKNKIILLYCNTGSRSKKAYNKLKKCGYINVKILNEEQK